MVEILACRGGFDPCGTLICLYPDTAFFWYYRPMQRLFTGLQPSGTLHIGNYLGALKQTVELLKDAEGLVMIADYHALTTLKDTEGLRKNIPDVVRDFVAVGVDPKKTIVFKQSSVPQHTELA